MASRYVIPEHVLTRELDGELVMLNLESERYFGLDETGTRFWYALRDSGDLDEVAAHLDTEFDVGVEQIAADLDDLIDELTSHGLVELATPE